MFLPINWNEEDHWMILILGQTWKKEATTSPNLIQWIQISNFFLLYFASLRLWLLDILDDLKNYLPTPFMTISYFTWSDMQTYPSSTSRSFQKICGNTNILLRGLKFPIRPKFRPENLLGFNFWQVCSVQISCKTSGYDQRLH